MKDRIERALDGDYSGDSTTLINELVEEVKRLREEASRLKRVKPLSLSGTEKRILEKLKLRPCTTDELTAIAKDFLGSRLSNLRSNGYCIEFVQTGPGRKGIYTLTKGIVKRKATTITETIPICKLCGVQPCQYYGKVGEYSVACNQCNEKNSKRQRERRERERKRQPKMRAAQ